MTLAQLASLICTEINQQETEDISACKTFLQRGFAIIWQAALWKDSLFEYTQTLGSAAYVVSDTWLPTKKVLLTPADIHQVVAVRTDTAHLNVESSETFYRADWDQFADTGKPRNYRLLAPCVWELDSSMLVNIAGGDDDATQTTTYLDANNKVSQLTAQVGLQSSITTDRIDAVTKVVTSSELVFSQASTGTGFFTFAAADTNAAKRQRVQLFGTVDAGTVIRVLGKVKAPIFTDDADEPALTGCEDSLIAFAQARMLRRERQYAKAQAMMQEATALLAQLKAEQTVQQAYSKRLIPEGGYGDEWGLNRGVYSTLQ